MQASLLEWEPGAQAAMRREVPRLVKRARPYQLEALDGGGQRLSDEQYRAALARPDAGSDG